MMYLGTIVDYPKSGIENRFKMKTMRCLLNLFVFVVLALLFGVTNTAQGTVLREARQWVWNSGWHGWYGYFWQDQVYISTKVECNAELPVEITAYSGA